MLLWWSFFCPFIGDGIRVFVVADLSLIWCCDFMYDLMVQVDAYKAPVCSLSPTASLLVQVQVHESTVPLRPLSPTTCVLPAVFALSAAVQSLFLVSLLQRCCHLPPWKPISSLFLNPDVFPESQCSGPACRAGSVRVSTFVCSLHSWRLPIPLLSSAHSFVTRFFTRGRHAFLWPDLLRASKRNLTHLYNPVSSVRFLLRSWRRDDGPAVYLCSCVGRTRRKMKSSAHQVQIFGGAHFYI